MPREAVVDSRQEILRTAARLFQQRGYDATSMNDVAASLKLVSTGVSKARDWESIRARSKKVCPVQHQ